MAVAFLEVVEEEVEDGGGGVKVTTAMEVDVGGATGVAATEGVSVLVCTTTTGLVGVGATETCVTTCTAVVVGATGVCTITLVLVTGSGATTELAGVSQKPTISSRRGLK